MKQISFIDTEVSISDQKAYDFGAVDQDDDSIHTGSFKEFYRFIDDSDYLCGHNIIDHDLKYIEAPENAKYIDTLYLSPLLFPNKPYHRLLKDDKLITDELNNPLNDSQKAKSLFFDEINAFNELDDELKSIFYTLLKDSKYFFGFFDYLGYSASIDISETILRRFSGKLCENAPIRSISIGAPIELAYCLALITATEEYSLIPRWVQVRYPNVEMVMRALRGTTCRTCEYCRKNLNSIAYLRKYFGYPGFREYNGEALQEKAVNAAVDHKSLLAVFPTGGGKSLTFQVPALMAGETERGLTVVISPLQSLMKDQVDNLENRGIVEAVTINGLLSPIERAEAIDRVESGIATLLYISPESLRSVTMEKLLLSRNISRFVIDEAHCFSAWGQDFRVDYLYIGDFIRELQEKKGAGNRIPVSCFTATAKQKVISDIKDYFKNKLDINLELFTTDASRTNLRYEVLYRETENEKYDTLRNLIEQKHCPTIVYVSRTRRTVDLSEKLNKDGFVARPFNGKMESSEKQENQEAFINDEVQIIVATSAFGMGVDKSNVKLVVHYDISDSLENYVQEAGRAGRDQSLEAECYVLFNDGDLDKHFMLLNQTKLSISEINQVWKAIKNLSGTREIFSCSALEVARAAGWDDGVSDIETRVRTAIQALENAGYVKRGKNSPKVYADSILVKTMAEAAERIDGSSMFDTEEDRTAAKRIMKSLISNKSISRAGNDEAEARVDYIADRLGIEKEDVIKSVERMREEGLLADAKDLTAYIKKSDTANKSMLVLRRFLSLEQFLLDYIDEDRFTLNYKELNDEAIRNGVKNSSVNAIKTLFYYWTIRGYIQKDQDQSTGRVVLVPKMEISRIKNIRQKSYSVSEFVIDYLYKRSSALINDREEVLVSFSVIELSNEYRLNSLIEVGPNDIEEALLFLDKIGALKLEGGFLVLYNGMRIKRLSFDNKIRYKADDYKQLNEYYKQKIQQIHIVGEYANMMVRDYNAALKFVNDYFQMDYKKFLSLYFSEERYAEIERNITPKKYDQLFKSLSQEQLDIVNDSDSKYIAVSAGPGSGKTKVLVHKLASLLLLEDIKHEQLLMLTFSRAAAIEFKMRLKELIGNAANFVEIKTFHSYCFDLLGKVGNIVDSENIVKNAVDLLHSGDVDLGRITKSVLVIDEAQDMDQNEYGLVELLMNHNDDMRVIAVGDDDQNIYQFRGSDSKYFKSLISDHGAKQYNLLANYRSCKDIVSFSNRFVKRISSRMKSEAIYPVTDANGEVKLIKHTSENMEMALVNDLVSANLHGTNCILTNTNNEAMVILGMLRQKGLPAKMIQTNDGFELYNIAEVRFFLKRLLHRKTSPVISDGQWNMAKKELENEYSRSACLGIVLKMLDTFEGLYNIKYRTDLEMFLHESKLEDFYEDESGVITVSTMHKSKGREFDNVFMLVNTVDMRSDEELRKLYVAITRAKNSLHVHYRGSSFDDFLNQGFNQLVDTQDYEKPKELVLQLSYKDVVLDYFKDKKDLVLRQIGLKSGDHLVIEGDRLYADDKSVLKFSTSCRDKIDLLMRDGYTPFDAVTRFVLAWKGKEDTEETVVILPDLCFRR